MEKNEADIWQEKVDMLENTSTISQAQVEVLEALKKWGPEQASTLWRIPMWFRDLYLHDDSFRGEIRAYALSSFFNTCNSLVTGENLSCSIDVAIRSTEAGMEVLRNVHKIPYYCQANMEEIPWRKWAKSCSAFLCHACAITAELLDSVSSPTNIYTTPFMLGAKALQGGSLIFLSTTAVLAMEDEFIDVVLRSLKRYYEIAGKKSHTAVVLQMIASRTKKKIE